MQLDHYVGKQVDDFTIQERIGQGGMATVYRAFQPSVNRSVALKIISLNPNQGERDEFRSRFAQEAKVIASLEHIHILPIYDYGIVSNELAYLAMRLLRGGSLADLLLDGPLDLERAADIFTQIARGLAYAHSKGVIHRDLKPSNILLDDAGNAYLTDFGLAKMMESSLQLTKTGNIVGTPIYMSPEQLRGDPIDRRSDIYSLGGILYHMLVGRPPFEASETNMVSVIYQHLEKEPPPPSTLNPAIPHVVEQVALKALAKNPDDRYATATEMADALNTALGRKLSTSSYPAVRMDERRALAEKSRVQSRLRKLSPLIFVTALVALIVIAALLVVFNGGGPVPQATADVLEGEAAPASQAVPTQEEIAAARARLAPVGFVALITCNQTSQYHAAQAREISELAGRYGLSFRVYDSNNDKYAQLTQIERARADGASGLIICPLDVELLRDPLSSAEVAGVPMVFLTTREENYSGVFLDGDDYLLGVEAGRAAGRIIRDEMGGRANAIILDYPDLPYIVSRANGMQDGVLEVAPGTRIIGRYLGGTRENGEASVEQLIEDGVSFNVILSINDIGSYGAIMAMERHGFSPSSTIISSVDAEALAREHIANGYFMRASVEVGRVMFSHTSVNAMVKLLAGSVVPETYLVPPGAVITRETMMSLDPRAG